MPDDACTVPLVLVQFWSESNKTKRYHISHRSDITCTKGNPGTEPSTHTRTRQHAEWHLLCAFCTLTSASGRSQLWQKSCSMCSFVVPPFCTWYDWSRRVGSLTCIPSVPFPLSITNRKCDWLLGSKVWAFWAHPKSDPDQTSSNCKAQAATSCETFTCTLNAQVNIPASCVPRHPEPLKPLQPPATSHVHTTSPSFQPFSTVPFCEY